MSRLYQNRIGHLKFDPTVDTSMEVANASLPSFGGVTEFSCGFFYAPISDTAGGTEFLVRLGSSTANDPSIGFRHRASLNDYVVYIDGSGGTVSVNIGDLTNGHIYAIFVAFQGGGLSTTDHTAASAGDRAIVYVYEVYNGTAWVRTPTATVTTSSSTSADAGLSARTGISIMAQVGYTTFGIYDLWYKAGDALTTVAANKFGQYTANASTFTPTYHWTLGYYASAEISASPADYELYHLSERVSGTYNLTAAGTTRPSWVASQLRQQLPSSEDTVQSHTFDESTSLNYSKTKLRNGCILGLHGDSKAREDLSARNGYAFLGALIAGGYEFGSWISYLRNSATPVTTSVPSFTGVTARWCCNAALGGTYNTDVGFGGAGTPNDTGDKFGLPMGGILELVSSSATPTLGTNNEVLSLGISNSQSGQTLFTAADDIYARVFLYTTPESARNPNTNFTGTVQLVSAAETVEVDVSTLSTTPGTISVLGDVHMGTGSTSYTLSVRVKTPSELGSAKVLCIANVMVYKKVGGSRKTGSRVLHKFVCHDNSSSWSDHTTSQNATTGSKKYTNAHIESLLDAAFSEVSSLPILSVMSIQTESFSQASVETSMDTWVSRWDTIQTDLGWTAGWGALIIALETSGVGEDSVTKDRQHALDYRNAFFAANTADPSHIECWSMFDWSYGYWLISTETLYDNLTETGIGETEEAEADSAFLAKMGGTLPAFTTDPVHPAEATFVSAAMEDMVTAIEAGIVIGTSAGGRVTRVGRTSRT